MSLSIYKFIAYYISNGKLAQMVSERFGVQIHSAASKWEGTVAAQHMTG